MYCRILKIIRETKEKKISIIECNNKKYILKSFSCLDKTSVNMLRNEINILYKLRNIDICPKIISYKLDDKRNYILIEYIEGRTINKLKFKNTKEKIILMLKIIDAVKLIHSYNIIHCDLKPDNILFDNNGNIKIIDFGISVNDQKNYFKKYGSVKYCSRNQLVGIKIDLTTDIYSLGIIFYELLFGKIPFVGDKKTIMKKKINYVYNKTNNNFINLILYKIFNDSEIKYYKLDQFENDLKLLFHNK